MQVVLRMAHGSAEIEADVKSKIDEFAGRGFRALGLALSEGGSGQARCAISRLSADKSHIVFQCFGQEGIMAL